MPRDCWTTFDRWWMPDSKKGQHGKDSTYVVNIQQFRSRGVNGYLYSMLCSSLACYTLPQVCNTFEESEFNKEPVLYPTLDGVTHSRLCNI